MSSSNHDLINIWRSLYKFCQTFGLLTQINLVLILILTILWAFFIIRALWKDYRKEKMYSKLRNTVPEYQWLNTMNNFCSNRIKNRLLLSICLSESALTVMLVSNQLGNFLSITEESMEKKLEVFIQDLPFVALYDKSEHPAPSRFYSISILTTICLLAFLVRILTQYMVYQYSYFKPRLNLKFEIYISLSCLFLLSLMATFLQLHMVFYVCIVFLLFYEYILLIIATRKLRLLLKQRLSDAILHENQSNNVIHYYRIGYKDYKICSTVMLVALFAQYVGIILCCFNTIFGSSMYTYGNLYPVLLYQFIIAIEQFLFSLGTSIQILVYIIVSIRRLFRYIKSCININRQTSSQRSSIQSMIDRNYTAYRMKNEF